MKNNEPQQPVPFLAGFAAPELLNLLADGAYITDTDRQIVFWNQAAQRITGWRSEEVVGRSCRDNILVHVDKDGHPLCGHEHCPLHRCIITGEPSAGPLLVFAQHRSGSRIPVEVTVAPIRNHSGQILGGIEVFRDLTESMQDQLRAKEIQELAVQCVLPDDSRVILEMCYQPRDIVGGDFFHVEKLDADWYVILVADAKGHGMAAALYTLLLRSLCQEQRRHLNDPARFMGILNARVRPLVLDGGYFGTAVLAAYNAASGALRLVRAGHPSQLLFRTCGTAETIGVANPALGLFQNTTYQESSGWLESGDALLLFTDGATELFDSAERELGKEGLLRLVRDQSHEGRFTNFNLGRLEEQLLRFSNQIHLPDDLTLVKLCRQS